MCLKSWASYPSAHADPWSFAHPSYGHTPCAAPSPLQLAMSHGQAVAHEMFAALVHGCWAMHAHSMGYAPAPWAVGGTGFAGFGAPAWHGHPPVYSTHTPAPPHMQSYPHAGWLSPAHDAWHNPVYAPAHTSAPVPWHGASAAPIIGHALGVGPDWDMPYPFSEPTPMGRAPHYPQHRGGDTRPERGPAGGGHDDPDAIVAPHGDQHVNGSPARTGGRLGPVFEPAARHTNSSPDRVNHDQLPPHPGDGRVPISTDGFDAAGGRAGAGLGVSGRMDGDGGRAGHEGRDGRMASGGHAPGGTRAGSPGADHDRPNRDHEDHAGSRHPLTSTAQLNGRHVDDHGAHPHT